MNDPVPVTIYHNPACGTSRNALALIRDSGIEPTVIEYLKTPPDRATLESLIARMGIRPRALLREKGTPYAELELSADHWSDAQLIDFMLAHPILINRPIVVTPRGVKLCRPSEAVLEILPPPANKTRKQRARQQAAIGAVRDCAQLIETQAGDLLQALPSLELDRRPRAALGIHCAALGDTARRVQFEIALLQQQLADGQEADAGALQRLTQLEATIMSGLAGFTDVVDALEAAAEHDEKQEPAFGRVMETLAALLHKFQDAKTATEALRDISD
jgi:arsenate reductase